MTLTQTPAPAAQAQDAAPQSEYQAIVVEVAGRDIERTKVVVQELMAGEIADSMEDLFAVLGALLEQAKRNGKKMTSLADLESVDFKSLLMQRVRTAIFNIVARAAGVSPEVVRGYDMNSLLAVTTATVVANQSFFSTLPALLGLGKAAGAPAETAASASPTA
ncbi:hypothetical protein [Burkholderia cepacia]|uniref:hypothetical protein n=1 Tax=Burkholderia cepacia TaxID=292 RepID=UPI0007530691|nr:hypothetical protein [Burkholderia cepacia]KWF99095.1 hypothetical protein WL95_00325 [Burkholderia cepacia]